MESTKEQVCDSSVDAQYLRKILQLQFSFRLSHIFVDATTRESPKRIKSRYISLTKFIASFSYKFPLANPPRLLKSQ